jgi:hypothetical protein
VTWVKYLDGILLSSHGGDQLLHEGGYIWTAFARILWCRSLISLHQHHCISLRYLKSIIYSSIREIVRLEFKSSANWCKYNE